MSINPNEAINKWKCLKFSLVARNWVIKHLNLALCGIEHEILALNSPNKNGK